MESLDVYLCDCAVGTLMRSDSGGLSFKYRREYLEGNAIPLSSTLPLDAETYGERDIAAFFSNLLPDESVRQKIADILHLTPEDTFGLLRMIGADCAGAIAFHEPGTFALTSTQPTYRELTESEASLLLTDLSNRPLGIGDDFRGISGAGAQDKLIACVRDGKILLPQNGTPSTHIIKPGIDRFPESVFNEWFCMRLSNACGFETAECDILEIGGMPYYVTTRYDRETQDGTTKRLHQEDFCQLLKCRPEIKYQDQGGPSIVDCIRMLQALRLPSSDVIGFIDRVVFNFLIGNGDAHGKNFSVLYRTRAPRLAPVYDALCTTVYPAIAKKMAMKFDGKFEFRWVSANKIARTFARAGINKKVIFDSITRQIAALRKNLPAMSGLADREHPSPVYHDIIKGIHTRIRQLEIEK